MERLSTMSSTVALADRQSQDSGRAERKPRRLLHFSDGVVEEYSTDEEEGEESTPPPINPQTLPWLPWMWYYVQSAAVKTFSAADVCGERLAWLFGITSPKYQYAIDEYHRQQAEEREEREREERERQAVRERREGGIRTVSQLSSPTSHPPTSDRCLVEGYQPVSSVPIVNIPSIAQYQVISDNSINQSQASLHSTPIVNQSQASLHSTPIVNQSGVRIHVYRDKDESEDMSVFPA